jgi:hypothetical protein
MASNELAAKLQRRTEMIERAELLEQQQQQQQQEVPITGSSDVAQQPPVDMDDTSATTNCFASELRMTAWHPHSEFKEFTRKQLQHYQKMFSRFLSCLKISLFGYSALAVGLCRSRLFAIIKWTGYLWLITLKLKLF